MNYYPHCKNRKVRTKRSKAKHDASFRVEKWKIEKLKKEHPEIPVFDLLAVATDFPKLQKSKKAKIANFEKRKFEKLKNSHFGVTLPRTQRKGEK